jgi:DNA-binding CsgD family transcriptional regulator
VLRDTPGRSRGQQSLCASLIALSHAATLEDDRAREELGEAIARLGRSRNREPAHEQFYRRLSRTTIAATCVVLGDDVRADRVVAVRDFAVVREFKDVPRLVRDKRWSDFPPSLRGVARLYAAAVASRASQCAPAGLTRAELEVLNLLGRGWSASRIATATERSVNTVYSHTRSILGKLEATRAPEAVAIARSRGYIT